MNIITIIILVLDQLTKYLADRFLKGSDSVNLIGGFLKLTYVENRGAAFGILEDKKIFFILTTLFIMGVLIYFLIFKKALVSKKLEISLKLILAGALGNLIDRLLYSYVIDFIDIKFGQIYDFPVFNIADMSIVIGTILLIYLMINDRLDEDDDIVER